MLIIYEVIVKSPICISFLERMQGLNTLHYLSHAPNPELSKYCCYH
jgi:hypothetical protein